MKELFEKNCEQLQAVFFDFDGVLVDSVPIKTEAFYALFEPYGSDIAEKAKDYHLQNGGVSRYEKFKYYYREFLGKEITPSEMQDLSDRFSQIVLEKVITEAEIPGATALLNYLQNKSTRFVVSGTPDAELAQIVNGRDWRGYFDEIYGSPRGKIEILTELFEAHGFDASRCIFSGDALSDYEAASAHGVHFFGIIRDEENPLLNLNPVPAHAKDLNEFMERML